jgi:hypothetical protein
MDERHRGARRRSIEARKDISCVETETLCISPQKATYEDLAREVIELVLLDRAQ